MNHHVEVMEQDLEIVESFDMELQDQQMDYLEEHIHRHYLMVNDYDGDDVIQIDDESRVVDEDDHNYHYQIDLVHKMAFVEDPKKMALVDYRNH